MFPGRKFTPKRCIGQLGKSDYRSFVRLFGPVLPGGRRARMPNVATLLFEKSKRAYGDAGARDRTSSQSCRRDKSD